MQVFPVDAKRISPEWTFGRILSEIGALRQNGVRAARIGHHPRRGRNVLLDFFYFLQIDFRRRLIPLFILQVPIACDAVVELDHQTSAVVEKFSVHGFARGQSFFVCFAAQLLERQNLGVSGILQVPNECFTG